MIHSLKCDSKPFQAVWDGVKTAELRLDDRRYRVGDVVILWEHDREKDLYLGRHIRVRVTYITYNYGLQKGYVMLSFHKMGKGKKDFQPTFWSNI